MFICTNTCWKIHMILPFVLSPPCQKIIDVERETKKLKGIGKGIVIKPRNFYFGPIFVDISYQCYSSDLPKLSEVEGFRKHKGWKEDGLKPCTWELKQQTLDLFPTLEIEVLIGSHRVTCFFPEKWSPYPRGSICSAVWILRLLLLNALPVLHGNRHGPKQFLLSDDGILFLHLS